MATFLEDAKRYIGFTEADSEALKALFPHLKPYIPEVINHFYECVQAEPGALAVIQGGESQVERLKCTLREWLASGMIGPHGEAFYERRARIGRMHVHIGLPQVYMITATNVMRRDLRHLIQKIYADDFPTRRAAGDAMDRLLDLELAIMLHTYREDSEQRLSRQTRLVSIGQLAANIAHELRNPLGVIETSLYLLRRRVKEVPRVERHLDKIANQVSISSGIITDLLEMARDREPRKEAASVCELVSKALEGARTPNHITFSVEISEDLRVWVEPGLVVRSLINLIDNAVAILSQPSQGSAEGAAEGRVEIGAGTEGERVHIWVADDGPGFAKEMLHRAFEPLVTARSSGVGLGLALVQRVCERHAGDAVVENRPEGGAKVSLILPAPPARVSEGG